MYSGFGNQILELAKNCMLKWLRYLEFASKYPLKQGFKRGSFQLFQLGGECLSVYYSVLSALVHVCKFS